MLVRHLSKNYILDDSAKLVIRDFVYQFHRRWKTYDESQDMLMLTFSNNRQQGENELQTRDQILRQIFFKHLDENNVELTSKDSTRGFSELQKIQIYREAKGLCQQCLAEGKPESDSKISWKNYEADHILPHSKGGQTIIENGALLCKSHNRIKSDSFPT